MPGVQWEEMFPDELEAAFQRKPLVYFTYGLCEPHGPQNALGLDELKAHRIACLTAQRHGGIVAPPDYWHIHEIGGYAIWSHAEIGAPAAHLADGDAALAALQERVLPHPLRPTRWVSTPRSC